MAEMAEGDKTDADAKDKDGKKAEKDAKAEKPKTAAELKFSEEEKKDLSAKDIKVDNSDDKGKHGQCIFSQAFLTQVLH